MVQHNRFHKALSRSINYRRIRSGQDKATALAETKRQMMNDPDHPEYRDPFYWAAFVLQGEWSSSTGQ